MNISFIGMSGCGKSKWSMKLQEIGFRRFSCDDLITKKAQSNLTRPDGTIQNIGEWMGFPYEYQYKSRESKYLSLEAQALSEILDLLDKKHNRPGENIIVDTTGSVIYCGHKLLERLQETTMIVHLSSPPEIQTQMLEKYLVNKRPVLWQNLFNTRPNESNEDALERCYQKLIVTRKKLYQQLSHVTVPYRTNAKSGLTGFDIINRIFAIKASFPSYDRNQEIVPFID